MLKSYRTNLGECKCHLVIMELLKHVVNASTNQLVSNCRDKT